MERFKEDSRSDKLNLSIGLYYNEDGHYSAASGGGRGRSAPERAAPHGASLYCLMEGLKSYRHTVAPLLFGADHPVLQQQRVATIQTLGGSGALKAGGDSLRLLPAFRCPGSAIEPGKTISRFLKAQASRSALIRGSTTTPTACAGTTRCSNTEHAASAQYRAAASMLPQPMRYPDANDQRDGVVEVLKARAYRIPSRHRLPGFGAGMDDDAYAIARLRRGLPALVSSRSPKFSPCTVNASAGLSIICEDNHTALGAYWSVESYCTPQLLQSAELRRADCGCRAR
ncbi:aminotransferase class I/II-fold pyridoxal phosphate-dependent enzyme [Shigella flexneri]